jgi:TM2 domain-containing membrane protein YozV
MNKSFTTALLLSIFLGVFGIDRFYLGKIGTGILKLLVTIFTFGLFAWVWWIVDIVLIASGSMTDKNSQALIK